MYHFPFGSSTAARTNACQQWRAESEGLPRKESEFAIDGTIKHGVAEALALGAPIPKMVEGHNVEKEHVEVGKELWAKANEVMDKYDLVDYEPEVQGTTAPDVGGTLDLIAWNAHGVLALIDYKAGMGVQVDAENNAQILFAAAQVLYGKSSLADVVQAGEFNRFVGVIIQPDRSNELQAKEWEFGLEDVAQFWAAHKVNIELARQGMGDLVAGSHCKFCPANGLCDATTGNLLRMAQMDPEDLEQLRWALDHLDQVKDTIKAVEAKAYQQLEAGAEIPGWKLVQGRAGNTTWLDDTIAMAELKRAVRGKKDSEGRPLLKSLTLEKMLSPTQIKKVLKAYDIDPDPVLEPITHRPPPQKLTLAPESDKRPAALSTAALAASLNSVM